MRGAREMDETQDAKAARGKSGPARAESEMAAQARCGQAHAAREDASGAEREARAPRALAPSRA